MRCITLIYHAVPVQIQQRARWISQNACDIMTVEPVNFGKGRSQRSYPGWVITSKMEVECHEREAHHQMQLRSTDCSKGRYADRLLP